MVSDPCIGAREYTKVSCVIKDGLINDDGTIAVKGIAGQQDAVDIGFCDYIATLVCGLDVDVNIKFFDKTMVYKSISSIVSGDNQYDWLSGLICSKYAPHGVVPDGLILKYSSRLRPLMIGDEIVGYATINTSPLELPFSKSTIGGLESGGIGHVVGYIDYDPQSAKRDQIPSPRAAKSELVRWADEQMDILLSEGADKLELAMATLSFSNMGIDPTKILHAAIVVVNNQQAHLVFMNLEEMLAQLRGGGIMLFATNENIWNYCRHVEGGPYGNVCPTFIPLKSGGTFYILERSSPATEEEFTFMLCLADFARANGCLLSINKTSTVVGNFFGRPITAWHLSASPSNGRGN